jgi:predicted alpha-1,2-mannosidase
MGSGWQYAYDDYKIRGLKQTHQPSPWINDYGCFSLMPLTGTPRLEESERASWFSHKAETAEPNYYSVYLADYDVTAELTPTERGAFFRFTFPRSDSAFVFIDGFNKGSMIRVIPGERKITGYSSYNTGGVPDNFRNYFVMEFDRDFEMLISWSDEDGLSGAEKAEGRHACAMVGFNTDRGEQVAVRVASSFISPEQAQLNLEREIGVREFEEIRETGRKAWNDELGRIQVSGGTESRLNTFYSCLYRVLLFPRKFYEFDARDSLVHYSPYNGKVLPGYMFTDNGFWDTFRAVFPFYTLIYPSLNAKIMEGLANTYKESGWLPEWASPGHRNCMIGSNSTSIIADSYLKGIRGYDINTLYEAMVKNTGGHHPDIYSVGRYGAEYYNSLGYIPYDVGINENAARTLEYAYADFCLAKLAAELGKPAEEVELYEKRSMNYKNLYDPSTKLMRGRNENGSFQSPFNPLKWGDAFTEGNSLHYTWSVFHDIEGLIGLMGGEEEFIHMLDTVFSIPPDFDYSYYRRVIHEIREMQIVNMGNYAHGNQPIQHMIYLYTWAGEPWKTQAHVREVMDRLYAPRPDGYCGDEDNGQTSAWYIFSALGFYPVCPGSGQYVMGAPLFREAEILLENGKTFSISALENSPDHMYIDECRLDGKPISRNWVGHDELTDGGKLVFTMSGSPNKNRGIAPGDRPYSFSAEP